MQAEVGEKLSGLTHEDRLHFRVRQRRDARAVTFEQLPSSADSARCGDRHAGRSECFHVPKNRPLGYFHAPRELFRGHASVRLQEKKDREKPVGTHETKM